MLQEKTTIKMANDAEASLGIERAINTKNTMADTQILTPMVEESLGTAVLEAISMEIEIVEGVET